MNKNNYSKAGANIFIGVTMWKRTDIETNHPGQSFKVEENGHLISHRQFLILLSEDYEFIRWYNQVLIDCPFEAFFWENKPVTQQNLNEMYECSLIESSHLSRVTPDPVTFDSYFDDNFKAVQFPNIGGDARLIIPCPIADNSVYTHIGNFVREAPEHQIMSFWKLTGKEMLNQIQSYPRWLSTSGLGVYWLHIRIDSVPKYYQTESYKQLV